MDVMVERCKHRAIYLTLRSAQTFETDVEQSNAIIWSLHYLYSGHIKRQWLSGCGVRWLACWAALAMVIVPIKRHSAATIRFIRSGMDNTFGMTTHEITYYIFARWWCLKRFRLLGFKQSCSACNNKNRTQLQVELNLDAICVRKCRSIERMTQTYV